MEWKRTVRVSPSGVGRGSEQGLEESAAFVFVAVQRREGEHRAFGSVGGHSDEVGEDLALGFEPDDLLLVHRFLDRHPLRQGFQALLAFSDLRFELPALPAFPFVLPLLPTPHFPFQPSPSGTPRTAGSGSSARPLRRCRCKDDRARTRGARKKFSWFQRANIREATSTIGRSRRVVTVWWPLTHSRHTSRNLFLPMRVSRSDRR